MDWIFFVLSLMPLLLCALVWAICRVAGLSDARAENMSTAAEADSQDDCHLSEVRPRNRSFD